MIWNERAWDGVPFPELSDDQLLAICDKHGFGHAAIDRLPSTGVINTIYTLGDDLVLRVPKPGLLSDTYTESVAVPVAHASGVRTPALVAFDDDRDIVDVPYTVYERVHAGTLAFVDADDGDLVDVYHELGRDIARLHATVTDCPDPDGLLDDPGRHSTPEVAYETARRGFIGAEHVRFVERVFAAVEPALVDARRFRRFVHDDLQTTNVMADLDAYAAMIDWGDAGWGDPALDLCYLPITAVPHVLAGYREVMPIDGEDTIEARVWWDHIWDTLSNLRNRPEPGSIDEFRPGGQLFELLAFAMTDDGAAFVRRAMGR